MTCKHVCAALAIRICIPLQPLPSGSCLLTPLSCSRRVDREQITSPGCPMPCMAPCIIDGMPPPLPMPIPIAEDASTPGCMPTPGSCVLLGGSEPTAAYWPLMPGCCAMCPNCRQGHMSLTRTGFSKNQTSSESTHACATIPGTRQGMLSCQCISLFIRQGIACQQAQYAMCQRIAPSY